MIGSFRGGLCASFAFLDCCDNAKVVVAKSLELFMLQKDLPKVLTEARPRDFSGFTSFVLVNHVLRKVQTRTKAK